MEVKSTQDLRLILTQLGMSGDEVNLYAGIAEFVDEVRGFSGATRSHGIEMCDNIVETIMDGYDADDSYVLSSKDYEHISGMVEEIHDSLEELETSTDEGASLLCSFATNHIRSRAQIKAIAIQQRN